MVEDSLNGCLSPVQLSRKQHVVYGEVLHHWVVLIDCGQSLHQPGVTVAGQEGVEPLAILEGVQGEGHLHTLLLLLDPEQISLQIELEGDLLQSHPTAGVPVQFDHLLDLPSTCSPTNTNNCNNISVCLPTLPGSGVFRMVEFSTLSMFCWR